MVKILIIAISIMLLSAMINSTISRENTKSIEKIEEIKKDSNIVNIKTLPLNLKNLEYALNHYKVKYPKIVIRQYILETGWGKSYTCKTKNNLFGLTNPRTKNYFEFDHWSESVKGYRDMVQYKYKNGNYYSFLKNLPYAEDPNYINKLKNIKYDIR